MLRIKWFPPSWVQIKTNGSILYIDPSYLKKYYSKHPTNIEYTTWPDDIDGLPEKLEIANLILLTHEHKDHCKLVTINRLSNEHTLIYGPEKCKKEIRNIVVGKIGEEIIKNDFTVKVIPSYNTVDGFAENKVHKKGKCFGYIIQVDKLNVYHPGDSSYIPEMNDLINIDVAFIPIDGKFTMTVEEAINASIAINPRIVVPIHDMGNADPEIFKNRLESISNIKVQILKIGGEIDLIG